MRNFPRLAGLAGLSPACALVGGLVDERLHLGFTNWQSACRGSGISLRSLLVFTFELLPGAVIGALVGGLLVLAVAFENRHRAADVADCLAAHAGCALVMPVGLMLCALALPVPMMLATEVVLAAVAAWLLQTLSRRHGGAPLHP